MKTRFSKFLTTIGIAIFSFNGAFAQFTIGNDTTICSSPFTLQVGGNSGSGGTATFLDCSSFVGCDDGYSSPINIGFTFNYYGNNYTQCVFGSNGVINFDLSNALSYCQWPISTAIPTASNPIDAIMWPWHDIYYPAAAGGTAFFSYATYGTAPNRYAVFDMCNVPLYGGSCNALLTSQQLVIYETTNIIEIHLTDKPLCVAWNGGNSIEGVQNSSGTMAEWVPGRNFPSQWSAASDGYRFEPSGGGYTVTSIPYVLVPMNAANVIGWYENGVLIGNGPTMVVNPPVGTSIYTAIANVCGGVGNDTMLLTYDPMTLGLSSVNPSCANSANGSVTATAAGTGPYDYIWTDSTGTIVLSDLNNNGPSLLNNQYVGTYYVSVEGALGCILEDSATLSAAFFQADFASIPTGYCQHKTLQFQDLSSGTTSIDWRWDFGDGSSILPFVQNPTHIYNDTGLFTVTLINFVPGGCSDTMSHVIQVWPATIADFTITPSIVCPGQTVIFRDKSRYYPEQWNWDYGDLSALGSDSISTHIYTQAGVYPITLVVTDSLCGNDTLTISVSVAAYPIGYIGNDTAICKGTVLALDAGYPGVEYLWSNGATTQTISISPQKPTEYSVVLNNHGCTFSDAIEIGILCEMYIPNAFSPNRDGKNDLFIPFGTEVTHVSMRIFNRWGQMVYSGSSDNKSYKGWNGYIGSDPAAVGVYTYDIRATFINNETKEYKGNLTLIQ